MSRPSPLQFSLPVHVSSEDSSPQTARKRLTGKRDLQWARNVMWDNAEDSKDEYMTTEEIIDEASMLQTMILEAASILVLNRTRVENHMNKK